MALIDDFKARFPEFATATVDAYLPTLEVIWPSYYGGVDYTSAPSTDAAKRINEAVLNLLAHLLIGETNTQSAATQQVASVAIGSVSESYQAGAQSSGFTSDWLRSSKYGQRFLLLTAGRYGGVAV